MVRIAPIKLFYSPATLWFDPQQLDVHKGDAVVVLTARGVEYGEATGDVFEVDEAAVKKLKSPLKPVKRFATDEDFQTALEMKRRSDEALPVFKEMAAEANANMRPVSVEYLLDGDKAIFYFESEERVDFRDLVRRLAAHFHVRIDMRQIGVRDEARIVGGLGHCGQELCCKRLGGEFCPVSIRMAKEQDLSLNPQKISGVCGRLMCCLRYEFDAYKEFKSRAPKQNAIVQTPDGPAKVVDLDVPREIVSLRREGEKPVKVPLADMESDEKGTRPNRVGDEAWERATAQTALPLVGESSFLTSQFTGADKLAEAGRVRRNGSGGGKGKGGNARRNAGGGSVASSGESGRKQRRRSTKVGGDVDEAAARKQKPQGGAGPKKRQGGKKGQGQQQKPQGGAPRRQDNGAPGSTPAKGGPRPGQKSSGLRQPKSTSRPSSDAGRGGEGQRRRQQQRRATDDAAATTTRPVRRPAADAGVPAGAAGEGGHRRARQRSHKSGGSPDGQSGQQGVQ